MQLDLRSSYLLIKISSLNKVKKNLKKIEERGEDARQRWRGRQNKFFIQNE